MRYLNYRWSLELPEIVRIERIIYSIQGRLLSLGLHGFI